MAFNYSTPAGVKSAMQHLMPGSWTVPLCDDLHRAIHQYYADPDPQPFPHLATPAEVTPLLAAVDFTQVFNLTNLWGIDSDGIAGAFSQARYQFISDNGQSDPLQPFTYKRFKAGEIADALISCPWQPLMDLAIALAVSSEPAVACFLTPCSYLTTAHQARRIFLKQLQHNGQLMGINSLPNTVQHQPFMWIIIFSSPEFKQQLVRPEFREVSLSCLIG